MGWRLNAGVEEAFLEMQAAGLPGGFKVQVTSGYDDSTGTETSRTTVSIDDIPDVAAELRKISAKRDKTDNIAVTPSYSSKWNVSYDIHSDSEELKAKLELWFRNTPTSISGSDSEGWNWNNLPTIEGYYEEDRSEIEGAYTYITYVSNTDLYGFSIIGQRPTVVTPGEPYVTPTGVKALAPKTELHALVPETSDTTVTLKPVDGVANWVEGVVGVGSFVETFSFKHVASVEAWNEDGDPVADFDAVLELDNTNSVIVNKLDSQTTEVILRATKNVDLYDLKDSTKHRGYIYEGAVLEFKLNETVDFAGTVPFRHDFDAGYWGEEAYIWDPIPDAVSIGVPDGYSQPGFYAVSAGSSPHIALPGSTGHARSFSLALVTDARGETGLVWEGGDIIEAFPGAKNIVPSTGEIVFDIKEVAPGKMLVNRTPGASGCSVTLTSESGSNYELTVNNDGELEVKES
ncbi:MAG: hypothetical protein II265_02145, partial [Clostridia bacterium]|nr:hypothetical protein [Clostridia bacterium]